MPLIGGLCLTAVFDQMWPKMCPSSEDFVMQRTLTKCGPKCAPHWRTLSCSGLWPNMAQNLPLIGGLCHAADFDQMWSKMCPSLKNFVMHWTSTKCGPKCAPRQRTLSHSGLQPNVAQNVPLIGGLCHAADFGSKCAPPWRTLSHSGLQPNVVQTCALRRVTSFCFGVRPHMDQQCTHHQKRAVPSKRILIVDQRRTKTDVSNYNAMWSIC